MVFTAGEAGIRPQLNGNTFVVAAAVRMNVGGNVSAGRRRVAAVSPIFVVVVDGNEERGAHGVGNLRFVTVQYVLYTKNAKHIFCDVHVRFAI